MVKWRVDLSKEMICMTTPFCPVQSVKKVHRRGSIVLLSLRSLSLRSLSWSPLFLGALSLRTMRSQIEFGGQQGRENGMQPKSRQSDSLELARRRNQMTINYSGLRSSGAPQRWHRLKTAREKALRGMQSSRHHEPPCGSLRCHFQ
jgi:hypothetical protein